MTIHAVTLFYLAGYEPIEERKSLPSKPPLSWYLPQFIQTNLSNFAFYAYHNDQNTALQGEKLTFNERARLGEAILLWDLEDPDFAEQVDIVSIVHVAADLIRGCPPSNTLARERILVYEN